MDNNSSDNNSNTKYIPYEDYQKDIINLRAQAATGAGAAGSNDNKDEHLTLPPYHDNHDDIPLLSSSKSMPSICQDSEAALTASDIAKPGGFRRHYVQKTNNTTTTHNPLTSSSTTRVNNRELTTLKSPLLPDKNVKSSSSSTDNNNRCDNAMLSSIRDNGAAAAAALKESIMDNLTYMFDFFTDVENNNGYDDDRGGLFDDRTSKELSLKVKPPREKSGIIKTILSIFKSFIGVGILFLPNAFHNGGWLFSSICMLLSALLSTIGMYKLSACHEITHKTYPQMGYTAYGHFGYIMISFQLALSQFCFGMTGVIYITNTLSHIVACIMSGNAAADASTAAAAQHHHQLVSESLKESILNNYDKIIDSFYIIVLLTYIPLSFIRRIGNMKFTNLVGDLCILLAVIFVIISASKCLYINGIASNVKAIVPDRMLSFIGTAVYSFEGIGLVIPIRESMAKPQYFNIVLTCMITFMGLMLCAFGLIGYLAWGPTVEPVVLNQLSVTPSSITIQLLYCIAVTCTFPITLYPTFTIIEVHIFKTMKASKTRTWLKNLLRASETTLCVLLAFFAAEDVEMFVSFVGTFCSIPLAFILPAALHRRLVGGKDISDWLLIIIGLICIPITLYIDYTLWGATI